MRIINQIEINEYTVIEVSDQTCFGNYAVIEGKEYPKEIVYDFFRIFFKLDSILQRHGIYHHHLVML